MADSLKTEPGGITLSSHEIDKTPPQSIEAEENIIGSLLIDKNAIHRIVDLLRADDFYRKKHQIIYESCLDLYHANEPTDLTRVTARLEEKKQLKQIGGRAFLTTLVSRVPTAAHIASYAKLVAKKKTLRDLIEASYQIAALGYGDTEDLQVTLDNAEKIVFDIANRSITKEFAHIKPTLKEAYERLEKLDSDEKKLRGIATGLTDLDNLLSGLQQSDLVIIAARPSIGKTAIALDFARHAAVVEKKTVGIFSLEMSRDQLIDRLIAAQAGVNLWRLRTGNLSSSGTDNDFQRIQQAIGELSESPIYLDDEISPNIMHMRATARRLQAQKGLDLLLIDYIQLMHGLGRTESRVQEISEISRGLKTLARELNIPVVALSQLSRAVEHRSPQIPQLSDLRESGSIEQDADVVMFLYRQARDKSIKNPEPHIAEVHVSKHRNGPTGVVQVYFEESQAAFKSLERQHREEPESSSKPAEEPPIEDMI